MKEKIEIINTIKAPADLVKSAGLVEKHCIIGYDFTEQRPYIKRDLRAEVRTIAKREGVSLRQIALAIGVDYINFCKYIKGERGLPYDKVERLIALL